MASNWWTTQTLKWQAQMQTLEAQAQQLQAKLLNPTPDAGGGGGAAPSSSFQTRPDQHKTRPSEAGLHNVAQLENQNRRAAGVGDLLKAGPNY